MAKIRMIEAKNNKKINMKMRNNSNFLKNKILFIGGIMQRFYRLFLLAMIALLAVNVGLAQKPIVYVSGKLTPNNVRTFQKDSLYIINNEYVVGGTLLIEPGTEVQFYPNGRLIDSTGGRIIADGDASAVYTPQPNNGGLDMDPIAGASPLNPLNWSGYADLNYFTYSSGTATNRNTIKVNTVRDLTVHSTKENIVYNVVIDKSTRRLKNLTPGYVLGINEEIIPFEKAMMLQISRMVNDPNSDALLNNRPWKRIKTTTQTTDIVDITSGQIKFNGQNTNNISREWGHIVILPGARAAFFRNCKFEGFKKDTTVDRLPYYNVNQGGAGEVAAWRSVNEKLKQLSNGSGGAITSFSSRTWLLNVEFNNNRAFRRGGALQLLQAPNGFPGSFATLNDLVASVGEYDLNKNPNITDKDGLASQILAKPEVIIPRLSMLDEAAGTTPFAVAALETNDRDRQNWDDARLALYLGRIRNVKFTNNKAQLNNVGMVSVGIPPVTQVTDILTTPAAFPTNYGSTVAGGALYVSGNGEIPGTYDEANLNETANRMIEVGLGINNSINISTGTLTFPNADSFTATNNEAKNYQSNPSSPGANGGAIYAGAYTSLIVAGNFTSNKAQAPFMQSDALSVGADRYARGGAIFATNTQARLQVVGGKSRDLISNATLFTRNEAASGGAIYVSGNSSTYSSPIIGGADNTLERRDVGYNIQFDNNKALVYGGAIYTLRNMYVNGAGGATPIELIGYDDFNRTRFVNNTAGYSGGAISINIPNNSILRSFNRNIEFVRAYFGNNTVGNAVNNTNVAEIRGGGAVYNLNGNVGLIKGTEFNGNIVYNSNGGALTTVHPEQSQRRFVISDLDVVTYEPAADENNVFSTDLIPSFYTTADAIFTKAPGAPYPADVRMMTRFIGNKALTPDATILAAQSGSGVTQVGSGTLKTTEQLKGMFWINETTGYAVGGNGTVIKFTNGGDEWNYVSTGSTANLNDVFFTSSNVGYIVGNQGTLLKTTNGGTTWSAINVDVLTGGSPVVNTSNFTSISFVGSNSGYVTTNNGYVIRTSDAFVSNFNTNIDNNGIQASPLNNIYTSGVDNYTAVGEVKTILKRDLGFPSFTFQVSPVNAVFNTVWYTSSTRGYIGGTNGTILKTINGGIDWNQTINPATGTIGALTFVSPSKGFAVNGSGKVLTTVDAGDTWTEITGNTNLNALYDLSFPTPSIGFAVGNAGTLLKSTDAGATWKSVGPNDQSVVDVVRKHKGTDLPENGIGLGGAIYLLDKANIARIGRRDSIQFNRVRMQNNESYTGSVIYSDNYDLKLILNRTLIIGNKANSKVGVTQNVITGPIERDNTGRVIANKASSDLVPATIYGEIQGPLPSASFSVAANSIYNNDAKFLIRLPDAPNTKGVLAGTLGLGLGGTDTLRGNYWGQTEANVILEIQNIVLGAAKTTQETFFVEGNGTTVMKFIPTATTNLTEQGPFESISRYAYTPIPSMNNVNNEDLAAANTIPENLLLSGKVYDIYDKGTDVKTADYSKRRMSPIEDFAVGIAPISRTYAVANTPSNGKHVKRYIRDPFATEALSSGTLTNPWLASMQDEFRNDANGNSYQPLGMPLFLESRVNYDGLIENSNHDPLMLNEAVYFVINQTSGDLIRVNMRQLSEDAPGRELLRARVDLVPDSTISPATPLERYNRASIRRSGEGIANYGIGSDILNALYRNADREDKAVLVGRKYDANITDFANDASIFSNRPSITGKATYFAGERYRALPVCVGDKIQILSRTALWNQGIAAADAGSITFTISNSTMPPRFTGNIISLQKDTIVKIVPSELQSKRLLGIPDTIRMVELLNKKFITEDRSYPRVRGTYSSTTTLPENGRGTDSILTVTATDTNKFYDPRSFFAPDKFPRLTYTWNVDPTSGLARWMQADTIKVTNVGTPNANSQNPRDLALGYIKFRGQAINPYVVPGGEDVTVTAANYPPSFRLLDTLKSYGVTDQNILDYSVNIYGKYFHAPVYDNINARYLQQDTINSGKNFTVSHTYKMFVVDSLPRIFENDEPESAVTRTKSDGTLLDTIVHYVPSVYTCDLTQDGRLKANLTDKLRFQIDINSDDELEDNAAIAKGWDFKYGQSAYAFLNKVRNGGDINNPVDIVLDTTFIWDNDSQTYTAVLNQSKPGWLDDKYMYRYADETTQDQFVQDFTAKGQINIRIPRAQALTLLTPVNVQNNALNTDTSMTIILNDGHGGKTQKKYNVFVNVAPQILTNSLANAKEDFDYNPQLLDSNVNGTRMIRVFDANFGQARTFELIYKAYSSNTISKDPCYIEAGVWDVTNLKTTPEWLKINPITGLLYGKPGIKDAPKTESVTVLVTDAEGLTDLRTYQLVVEKTDHNPNLSAAPNVNCIDGTKSYLDTIVVSDRDLIRDASANPNEENLTLTVISPSGLTLEPSTVKGPLSDSTIKVVIKSTGTGFNPARDNDGKITVRIEVTDGAGNKSTLIYRLKVSEATRFVSNVKVTNSIGGTQILEWGTADRNVSTGDNTDGAAIGKLDSNYCEYELAPYPPTDVFDARWTIPTINGVVRSIYPSSVNKNQIYIAQLQPGDVTGSGSGNYPLTISWDMTSVPDKSDAAKNPTSSSWAIRDALSNGNLFSINMNTGDGRFVNGFEGKKNGNQYELTVNNTSTKAFVIFQDWNSDVATDYNPAFTNKISTVSPNPVVNQANIEFELANSNNVSIEIVDMLGNVVATVANGFYTPGQYKIVWTGAENMASGAYVVRMNAGTVTDTYSVTIVK